MSGSRTQYLLVYASIWKNLLLLVVVILFVAVGIWMIGQEGTPRRGFGLSDSTWGWITASFFGACAAVFLIQLFDRRPRLEIGAAGLTYAYSGRPSLGPIPWSHIAGVTVRPTGGKTTLFLDLVDPVATEQLVGPRQTMFGGSRSLKEEVAIPLMLLTESDEAILAAVERARKLAA